MVNIQGVILATLGLLLAAIYVDMTSSDVEVPTHNASLASVSVEPRHHPNILVLYVTIGLLTGTGFGLTYLPIMTVTKMHFTKNLGLACGISLAGTGFGQFVMAPIINVLLDQYNLAVVLYFFAAMFSLSLPFCLLFKIVKYTEKDDISSEENVSLSRFLSVLKTPSKMLLVVHVFLLNIGVYAVFTFFADRAISFGISEGKAATLVSLMGLANFLARIFSGLIIDKFRSKTIIILTSVHLINGVSILLSQFLKSFPAQLTAALIFGAGFGTKVTCMVVLVSIIDTNITHLLSLIYLSVGVASLIGPSLAGWLLDITGSHLAGFLLVSVVFILGALCLPLSWKLHNRQTIYSTKL